jgi:hypothetical protein
MLLQNSERGSLGDLQVSKNIEALRLACVQDSEKTGHLWLGVLEIFRMTQRAMPGANVSQDAESQVLGPFQLLQTAGFPVLKSL